MMTAFGTRSRLSGSASGRDDDQSIFFKRSGFRFA